MPSTGRPPAGMVEAGALPPGSHVCRVVESADEFDAWATECLADGARRGEKLFCFAPQARLDKLPVGGGTVTVADPSAAFLSGGPVEPAVMFAMFRRETATARRAGYRGLRLVADMDWLLSHQPTPAELAEFELLLDEVVTQLGVTVVCAYRTEHFAAASIAEMVAVHPHTSGTPPFEPGFRMWNVAGGTWAVSGEVDQDNVVWFARALAGAAGRGSTLRLRAAGLRFIAVAGIVAVMELAVSRPQVRIVVEDACPAWRRCWTMLDLDRQLPQVQFHAGTAARHANDAAPAPRPGEGLR